MIIGNREFNTDRTYIMGILNVTPDSFSDGGRWSDISAALRQAERMLSEGAAVIDVGGESTRPGFTPVSEAEEIRRIVPIIKAIKKELGAVVSIDTYKPAVARVALDAGADMINDIHGFKYDAAMSAAAAEYSAAVCLMHNARGRAVTDAVGDIISGLRESLAIADGAGIARERIILDPGIGFGRTASQDLEVIKRLEKLHSLGCPLLVGASRKSLIGSVLDLPSDARLEGTLAISAIAALKGAMFLRVHDVKENYRAAKLAEAVRFA